MFATAPSSESHPTQFDGHRPPLQKYRRGCARDEDHFNVPALTNRHPIAERCPHIAERCHAGSRGFQAPVAPAGCIRRRATFASVPSEGGLNKTVVAAKAL
jgi:hypothetical protein